MKAIVMRLVTSDNLPYVFQNGTRLRFDKLSDVSMLMSVTHHGLQEQVYFHDGDGMDDKYSLQIPLQAAKGMIFVLAALLQGEFMIEVKTEKREIYSFKKHMIYSQREGL